MKIGLVDVGGGFRGIYGAGVLDHCLEEGVSFDYCIGVSAGSANIASYLGGQQGRNYLYYAEYSFRKEYASLGNFLRNGSYIDLEYVYGILSNSGGENPLDLDTLKRNPAEMVIVASESKSGNTRYFTKDDLKPNSYKPLMASSCLPAICKPYVIDGTEYYDGALSDPIPLQKALDDGCDKVVVVLTKPRDTVRSVKDDKWIARLIKKRYPIAAKNLCLRAHRYNASVEKAKGLERQGKALIIAPDDISGLSTLKKDKQALQALYEKGLRDGQAIGPFLGSR